MKNDSRQVPLEPAREFAATRRAVLCGLAGSAVVWLGGCGETKPAGPPPNRIPLARLPEGQRVKVLVGKLPVELIRSGDSVQARSLLCTHEGCEVDWRPDLELYKCRCHEGKFDANGMPITAPPSRPMKKIPAAIEGQEVVLTL